jgi:ribosomal protein S19
MIVPKKKLSFINFYYLRQGLGQKSFKLKSKVSSNRVIDFFLFARRLRISKRFLGKRIAIYTGKIFFSIFIRPTSLGSFFSEFSITKKFGPLIHVSKKKKKKQKGKK